VSIPAGPDKFSVFPSQTGPSLVAVAVGSGLTVIEKVAEAAAALQVLDTVIIKFTVFPASANVEV
jgi:hypothetical protein